MFSKKILFLLLPAIIAAPIAVAQTPAPAPATTTAAPEAAKTIDGGTPTFLWPETPEKRAARVGPVDPGPDPDPKTIFYRYGKRFHIERYDNLRDRVVMTGNDPGWGRPYGYVNVYKEVYQKNEKYTWFWFEEHDIVAEAEAQRKADEKADSGWPPESLAYFKRTRSEFEPLTPPDAGKTITFVESSDGLPKTGSWRNSLCIADMNGDGFQDIIAPPERQGGNVPAIFLGDGKGHWKLWQVKWPYGLNYGSVAAADFNKDGHMDLAFSVHLDGVHVFLGDGKGTFTDSAEGLPRDFPSRRVVIADVDHDGYPDVVAISEGPTVVSTSGPANGGYAKIRAYLNRNKGKSWEGINIPEKTRELGGDWLATGNFNGDAYPDFIGSSVYYNSPDILYISNGPKKWTSAADHEGYLVPLLAYYRATTTGKFSSRKRDDAFMAYYRHWPDAIEPKLIPKPVAEDIAGIDRIDFNGTEPKRVPVIRWSTPAHVPSPGMGPGDFDGDGNLDLAFINMESREVVILLGDGKGNFKKAAVSGVKVDSNPIYDLRVADVNGDGHPDLIMGYESGGSSLGDRNGAIHVFLWKEVSAPAMAVK